MADWQQYGIVVVALLIGGGFAFGGIASYAGITSGSGGGNGGDQFNASLPSQNFREGPLGMNLREVSAVARYYDAVFVNAYYENSDQLDQLRRLRKLDQDFGERVYISLINSSEGSDIMIQYGITEFPAVVVMGAGGSSQPDKVSASAVRNAICNSFRTLGSASAQCL